MDMKLYVEVEGGSRQELESQIQLLTDLVECFGVKVVTAAGVKVLAREELKERHYEYILQEPHGGQTLQRLMDEGRRINLWIAYGETRNMGRKKVFTPFETYVIKNLLPHSRILSRSNQVQLILVTLERPIRQDSEQ